MQQGTSSRPAGLRGIRQNWQVLLAACAVGCIYYFSNPDPKHYYDYTFRIARALLSGDLGLTEKPPGWLNEFVPFNGKYYSVFPLGSVLTVMPFALLEKFGAIKGMPALFAASLTAALIFLLAFLVSGHYQLSKTARVALSLFPVLGSWLWTNLVFCGSWQLALGFAVLGEFGALYCSLVRPDPFLAGCFFALAFGNRTELILLAPLFFCFLLKNQNISPKEFRKVLPVIVNFCAAPLALGVYTLLYNQLRFASALDFGYSRIPGVLDEPWYAHGLFSLQAISGNFHEMITRTWRSVAHPPYFVPYGFGGSIFLASPVLLLLFRPGRTHGRLKWLMWGVVLLLTLVLWCHGNPGGWQFSYRYGVILLPWIFVIMLESQRGGLGVCSTVLLVLSIAINAFATYLWYWTKCVQAGAIPNPCL